MDLKNKVAIITGAGSGIGREICNTFAEQGAIIVLLGRNVSALETVNIELSKKTKCVTFQCDVSQENNVEKIVKNVIDNYGKIDILVNSAGVIIDGPVTNTSLNDWDSMMNTNLKGPFLTSKYVLPSMMKNKSGSIINISSIIGIIGCAGVSAYSASKGGLIMLTKSMALEYASHNIKINAICPGMVDTPMNENSRPTRNNSILNYIMSNSIIQKYFQHKVKLWEEVIPLKKVGDPKDIANMALFLASDKSNWITGSIFNVDGGLTAGLIV